MNKSEINGTIIGIIAIIIITIFPYTQIILLTLNGGLVYIFALPFDAATKSGITEQVALIMNSILAVFGLITFYISNKIWKLVLSSFLIMVSGQMLMALVSNEFNGGNNYLLGWLTVSGIPTIAILILGVIKYYSREKTSAQQHL